MPIYFMAAFCQSVSTGKGSNDDGSKEKMFVFHTLCQCFDVSGLRLIIYNYGTLYYLFSNFAT